MSDERILALIEAVRQHTERLANGDVAIKQLSDDLAKNTAATQRIEKSTADIVTFFQSVQGAFRVLEWIGKAARPVASITALGVAFWSAWELLKSHFPK